MTTDLPQSIWSFIGHFLRPYKGVVVFYVSLALLAGCWGPFNSMLIKHIINILSSTHGENSSLLIWPAVLLVVNFIVFDKVTWRTIGYLNYTFQPVIKNRVIHETFSYVLGSSHQYFLDTLSGTISSQIITLADSIERILHDIFVDFLRGASLVFIALISTYYVNPLFFYIMTVWFLVFSSFSIVMSKRLVYLSDRHTDAEAAVSGQVVDSISNMSTVEIFARRLYEVERLDTFLLTTKKTFQKKELFLVILHSIQGALIAAMLGCMAYTLIYLYGNHLISIGDFALILGLTMEVGHMTWSTMKQVDAFHEALGKCKQSLTSLLVPHDIYDKTNAQTVVVTKGSIAIENVSFHYKGSKSLFHTMSVMIEAGQKVGLVGYSGAGKSTFVNLILRMYDVLGGRILIDGYDIRTLTLDSLRSSIALIPQDPSLFHRSLMENIRYGRIEATDEEVYEAAQRAHAHEFIRALPQGYASPVGERGVKLSGGQRQRIALARALLKNAPILILDEATSQLDSVTESAIQESLWELMRGKTTLVIAHRLSTLLRMDRILVFDEGKIVEDGTHPKLLERGGLYKTLWDAQVGGFLPDKRNGDDL